MKRLSCGILVLLMVLSLFACTATSETISSTQNTESSRDEFYRDHQKLTAQTVEFNPDTMLRVDLPEVGLENVYIKQISDSFLLDADVYGKVYLLADDRYGGGMSTSDYYLLVNVSSKESVNDKMYIKDLVPEDYSSSASMSATLYFADLDGDEDMEIILHECKGMSGGAGNWLARIYDFKDGIEEIFSSYSPTDKYYATGFFGTLLKDNMLRIENSFTGYTYEFEVKRENKEYFEFWWYDENGNPKEHELWIDSFNKFEPSDADGDGVSEVVCRQYTCLNGHTDYVGSAITVLKFDNETNEFYVADAYFEPEQK